MSIIDTALGRGGIDARFTDWDTARNFVIFDAIVNNPRLSDETKVKLQDAEQQAYENNAGKWLESETEEIGRYYNQLRNTFPSITDDARFLAIFEAADSVKAAESSVTADDFTAAADSAKNTGVVLIALAGLGWLLFRD